MQALCGVNLHPSARVAFTVSLLCTESGHCSLVVGVFSLLPCFSTLCWITLSSTCCESPPLISNFPGEIPPLTTFSLVDGQQHVYARYTLFQRSQCDLFLEDVDSAPQSVTVVLSNVVKNIEARELQGGANNPSNHASVSLMTRVDVWI